MSEQDDAAELARLYNAQMPEVVRRGKELIEALPDEFTIMIELRAHLLVAATLCWQIEMHPDARTRAFVTLAKLTWERIELTPLPDTTEGTDR